MSQEAKREGKRGEEKEVSTGRMSCLQESARVHHSVVGLRSWIAEGALVEDTLLMGADYYEVGALLFVFERF